MAEIWGAAIAVGGSLLASSMQKKAGGQNAATAAGVSQADKDWWQKQNEAATTANRSNQETDFGTSKWTKDPTTGQWTQSSMLAAPEAARLQDARQMAADRMRAANNIDLSKPANWASGGGSFIGPQAAGGNVQTIRQPHVGQNNTWTPPPMGTPMAGGLAAGGSMLGGGAPPPAPAAPGPIDHAQIAPPGMTNPAAAAPTAPTAPTGPLTDPNAMTPEQKAALAQQQMQDQASNNMGNGSG
jgi:hypothetical protein